MPKGHLRRRRSKALKRSLDRTTPVVLHEQEKKIRALVPTLK
jgi:hypothetical protein